MNKKKKRGRRKKKKRKTNNNNNRHRLGGPIRIRSRCPKELLGLNFSCKEITRYGRGYCEANYITKEDRRADPDFTGERQTHGKREA